MRRKNTPPYCLESAETWHWVFVFSTFFLHPLQLTYLRLLSFALKLSPDACSGSVPLSSNPWCHQVR